MKGTSKKSEVSIQLIAPASGALQFFTSLIPIRFARVSIQLIAPASGADLKCSLFR